MKTIVFIGTNKSGSSREAIKTAESLGFFTVLFTSNEKQIMQRRQYPDIHEMILVNTNHLEEMRSEIRNLQTKGNEIQLIVSFVDSYVYRAAVLCDEFCQSYISKKAIKIMESKKATRAALQHETYTPKFTIFTEKNLTLLHDVLEGFAYPIMVKSPTSTGSKDVLCAENEEQVVQHIRRLRREDEGLSIILEEFIIGEQYLVEALIYEGEVYLAGVVEQEITQGKRFIITGYGVMATVPKKIQKKIRSILQSIVQELDIKNAALHLELRRSHLGWRLIEINPRISGGAMNNMLMAAFGYNLAEETLKLYQGKKPNLEQRTQNYVFTQHLIVSKKGILEKVTGRNRASRVDGVTEVYIKPKKGTRLMPPLSMGHRYAYVMAIGQQMEEAKEVAKRAAEEIQFHIITENDPAE